MEIYRDSKLILEINDKDVNLQVFNEKISMPEFNNVCKLNPRVKITDFIALKKLLNLDSTEKTKIGELKEIYELDISKDEMVAYLKIYLTNSEIDRDVDKVKTDIISFLNSKNILEGINHELLNSDIPSCKKFVVATGKAPISGENAKLVYYKLSERKVKEGTDGNMDFYDVKLIDNVEKDDWIGEKIPPTLGINGKTLFGKIVEPKPGKDAQLKYEKKSVYENPENGNYVLRAKFAGAVKFDGKKIGVDNHLVIHGDVDYSTGNVDFDGYVTIKGTVADLFSVEATKDITIEGKMGIGAVKFIKSRDGSVSISGGVNGKNTTKISAKRDVYLKYVNETSVVAGGDIHISQYSMDSYLEGKKIILSPKNGRIIGGQVKADHKIITGSIGNKFEKKTVVNVKGFERVMIKHELDSIEIILKETIGKANKLKRQLEIFESNKSRLEEKALNTFRALIINYDNIMDEIARTNIKLDHLEDMLKTRGDGEIKIVNGVYPKTVLEIKNLQRKVNDLMSCSFYVKDNELHLYD
ncbi:DUF342 domain-containing protein [Helicovermis profundi]|uniref:FapA family protein n=1 Tax=Helicovermis profundi TaxID=3065157 RepID=A0AAU9E3V0_9FIRM|nr:FapA family protein [Clostridia bacterium S502]